MSRYVVSNVLLAALDELNIGDPKSIRRVVVDLQVNHIPLVYVEHYGDDRILKVVRALAGVEVSVVDTATPQ